MRVSQFALMATVVELFGERVHDANMTAAMAGDDDRWWPKYARYDANTIAVQQCDSIATRSGFN